MPRVFCNTHAASNAARSKGDVTMALTRKLLKSLGLEESAIDTIIDAHTETTDALKKQRDDAIAEAGTVQAITQERDQLRQQVETLTQNSGDAAKVQAAFDAYKQQVEAEKANTTKRAALLKAFKAAGVQRDEFAELLLGKVDLSAVEMEGDAVKDASALIDPLKASYAGCFAVSAPQPTPSINPPPAPPAAYTAEQINNMSVEEINKNWDAIKGNLASPK